MCGGLRNLAKPWLAGEATTARSLFRRPTAPCLLKASQVQRVQLCDVYWRDAIALGDRVTVMRLVDCDGDTRVTGPAEEAGLPRHSRSQCCKRKSVLGGNAEIFCEAPGDRQGLEGASLLR
jgi:hypothetical protein